jgi:uncharacterized BrkB/YihY/UPF0761 family membrane protein
VTQTDTTSIQRDKDETLFLLTIFHILQGISLGFFDVKEGILPVFNLIARLIGALFLMHWFTLDARQHKYNISSLLLSIVALFALFAAPFYFLKTRGKHAWRTILIGFLFMVGCGSLTLASKAIVELMTLGEVRKNTALTESL